MGIMESLFDQEEVTRRWLIEERDEAQRVGEEIGRGIGEKRGRGIGAKNKTVEIAKQFMAMGNITLEQISQGTGLSMAELKKLQAKL